MRRVSQRTVDRWFAVHLWASDERMKRELAQGDVTNACKLGHDKRGNYHTACDGWIYERGHPSMPTCSCSCHRESPRRRRHWTKYPTIERVQAMFKRMDDRAA